MAVPLSLLVGAALAHPGRVVVVSAYALPLDSWAVARGWGGFNPAYVSGLYFFGSLLLEEVIFWLGTSFVTVSAVLIFVELERRGVPWWALPAAGVLPLEFFDDLGRPQSYTDRSAASLLRSK